MVKTIAFFARQCRFETTIQRSVDASGIGLHSGVPVNIRLAPAPAGTGVVFRRSDLDDWRRGGGRPRHLATVLRPAA